MSISLTRSATAETHRQERPLQPIARLLWATLRRLADCGFHRCGGICHIAGSECAPCNQVCGKPRRLCHHPCAEKCHAPSSCPEVEPCEAVITLQCPCGNLQSRAKCGVSIHAPNKEKTLKCNDSCMIAQRNAKLAEALGLNPSEKAAPAAYEHETLAYYAVTSNRKFCEEVEATLNDFIRSPRAGIILHRQTSSSANSPTSSQTSTSWQARVSIRNRDAVSVSGVSKTAASQSRF